MEMAANTLPHYGPQDIEKGVADLVPGDHVGKLLYASLGLNLNRQIDIKYARPVP